jgi:hypothetical protein
VTSGERLVGAVEADDQDGRVGGVARVGHPKVVADVAQAKCAGVDAIAGETGEEGGKLSGAREGREVVEEDLRVTSATHQSLL